MDILTTRKRSNIVAITTRLVSWSQNCRNFFGGRGLQRSPRPSSWISGEGKGKGRGRENGEEGRGKGKGCPPKSALDTPVRLNCSRQFIEKYLHLTIARCFWFLEAKFRGHVFRVSPRKNVLKEVPPLLKAQICPITCNNLETVRDRIS